MNAWGWFWACALAVAVVSFTSITFVVAWKGWGDLRRMLADLGQNQGEIDEPD